MKRVCQSCGSQLDDYVFVFQPLLPHQIVEDLKVKLPEIVFTISGITGNKVKLEVKQELNPGQITILQNYFTGKNYVEDTEAEQQEVYEKGIQAKSEIKDKKKKKRKEVET